MKDFYSPYRTKPRLHWLGLILAGWLLTACASIYGPPLAAGTPEREVIAHLGAPTHTYPASTRHPRVLEYMTGPFGQVTFLARISQGGRLLSYEQVLTSKNFADIHIGLDGKDDILHMLGAPSETTYLPLVHQEVWTYPYKENPVADSMMYVHFDDSGIVQRMLNGPDLRRDADRRGGVGFGFGLSR